MSETFRADFDVLMGWVAQGVQNRGDEFAAHWLVEEASRQPVAFMHMLLGVAKDRAAELENARAVIARMEGGGNAPE